ncbi:serine acetyltransferase [Klebsormidium nitens]|uniref:serine O-acetyltransferase n=1 Tax=Klebsormidium nitens TaxID=105231 RepID=A0A1Y1I692_KLENI|nr:serine acetyltransferase [Klebsormidium nitens]|eukprot:GAQ86474.1 serine acetyltransferase [Klebsormidium nitens]
MAMASCKAFSTLGSSLALGPLRSQSAGFAAPSKPVALPGFRNSVGGDLQVELRKRLECSCPAVRPCAHQGASPTSSVVHDVRDADSESAQLERVQNFKELFDRSLALRPRERVERVVPVPDYDSDGTGEQRWPEKEEGVAEGPACGRPEVDLGQPSDWLWQEIRAEARRDSDAEPALASFLYSTILAHGSLERALAFHLANKLSSSTLLGTQLFTIIADSFSADPDLWDAVKADICAVKDRDAACTSYSHCLLYFKGFLACQAYRVSHRLWNQGRIYMALTIQSRVSETFHVDFHPAARIGKGVLFDHATGVVVGETAQIGNNVSILHHVTLGGSGTLAKVRHPIVHDGVLIGAGATLLGPIVIGEGAKIGACSVVLTDVPPHTTAVGNPARLMGGKTNPTQLKEVPSESMDHTSFIENWSDYII